MASMWLALIVLANISGQITATEKCIYNGKEYRPGEHIPKECNKCYCLQQGNWLCTQRACRLTDLRGILLTPSNDVTIPRGSKLYVTCKSERKRSRFMWFVNGHHMTSSSKISSILEYSESVLRLEARDLLREITYITCFVPPFAPKRVKVTLVDVPSLPAGMPRIASQPETVETSPNYGVNLRCDVDGRQPMHITWFKFRIPLHSDNPAKWIVTPDGTLMIPAPDKSDSGLYECMATNAVGVAISQRATQLVINRGLPVKGGWCGWKQASEKCNASCGGFLHFKRECACPSPKNGGMNCVGQAEKFIECNLLECHKDVYGKVNVGNLKETDLLKGSCLHVGYAPVSGCKDKEDCQPSSVMTLRKLRIHRGRFFLPSFINYSMKLPGNLNGEFKFAAVVQLGHCHAKLSAYEMFKGHPGPVINKVTFSSGSSRTLVNLNAHSADKFKLLHGVVKFRPKFASVPPKSCLKILLFHDVVCHGPLDCGPVETFQISRPTIKDRKVEVNIPASNSLRPGSYLVEGVLNMGWCANDSNDSDDSKVQQKVRPGDYVSLKKKLLFVDQFVTHYKLDLTMDKVKENEKKTDITLSGVIRLQDDTDQVIPSDSCFIVEVREVYKCNEAEGCRRAYVGEKSVEWSNTDLWKLNERSGLPYKVHFKNVVGSKFEVNGILNVGWCKYSVKGKRRTRLNDYFSIQSHEVIIEHGKSDFQVDLKMAKVVSSYGLRRRTVEGIIEYESGLSRKAIEDSCVRLVLAETICIVGERCKKISLITKTVRDLLANTVDKIPFKINYRSQKKSAKVALYAVMNVGWCGEGDEVAESLRPGDLVGSVEMETGSSFATIKLKRRNHFKFIDTPLKKADLDQGSSQLQISLSLPSEFGKNIPSSSCVVLSIREERTCRNDLGCSDESLVKKVFRGIVKSRNDSVKIDMTLKPGLQRNVDYQFDVVLNQGWCSEGATNASWIKDGDLFNSIEQKFEDSTTSPDVIENVAFRVFKDNDQKIEKCSRKCPRILDPVCGSDNRTYNSLCVLKREACIFESGVTILHKGECERCKRGCSTKIEPICSRNGKTYDNLCIMEREACFEDSILAFRHNGKCGSVTMRGDVRFSLDQPLSEVDAGSCLVIKTRKAVYCKFPEKCPDFELAEIVLKDVIVPPDGKIPYEIIMNPRPMSSVYLVEAVLNRGWCSAESNSKEWIRNEDYFNVKEQPFAVQGSEEIYKDIPVTKLVNLKVVDKGTIPSAIRDPCSLIDCPYHGACHVVDGKAVCRCKLVCRMVAQPVCGSDGETYANECVMKSESCLSKKLIEVKHEGQCENFLKISGDILIDQLIPRIPAGSCLNIKIQKKCNELKGKCDIETLAEIKQKKVVIPPSNRMYYQMTIRPRPPPGIYIMSAVLNRGWCPGNRGSTEWIRIGDYENYLSNEIEISETGNIKKDVIIARFVPKDGERNYVVVEGEALLDGTGFKISNGSCMSIGLYQQDESCNGRCEDQPVLRYYIKNLSTFSGKNIPYRAVIKPRPKPGRYVLSVILNQGWCSEGSNEMIREGDLFINEGQQLEIGLAGDVYKEVKVTKYYPPGMPCITKDRTKVPNGAEIIDNGNGCHGCKCNNGSIECKPTVCPSLECNDGFLAIEDGDCCPSCIKYSKCHDPKSGRIYKNREELFNRTKDHCETCSCNMTGKFSCSKEVCPKLDCKKGIYIESSCCPVCASDIRCKDHKSGMLYKAGETWVNGEINGCSKCKCVTKPGSKSLGFIECIRPSCPRLNCVQQIYPKGYCCPICLKENANGPFKEEDVSYLQALIFNEVVSSEVSCSDEASGKIYVEGEVWSHNCMSYECKRSGIASRPKACPYLTCSSKYQMKKSGDCCPSCSAECLPKLFCASDSLILVVPRIFLPYTRATELVFSNCTSSGNATHFVLKTAFDQCGVKRSMEGDLMKYSNLAYTREDENAVISRVQLVQIPVVCMYPANTQRILSQEFIKRNRGVPVISPTPKDTGPVKAFDVFMKIIDEKGVELDAGKAMKFDPGEKVFVEIDGTGLVENKIRVKADYCYLTPTPGPKSFVNYTLIENGCAVDSTVEFQKSTGNGQHFSFRALVFTKTKVPGFYLHCDTVTCDEEDPTCFTGCRQRRSLPQNKPNIISREQSPDHKRKMQLTLHVIVG